MEIKAGYKSTEFWLSLVATLIGGLLASGVIPTDGVWGTITGLVTGLLASLGYSVSRAWVKVGASQSEALKAALPLPETPKR